MEIFKKIISVSTLVILITLISPINLAFAEEELLYKLYLDQAKEYEGNDFGKILDNSAKVLQMVGTHTSCPNFTRYTGKTFTNVEGFTREFKEMMDLVNHECMAYINKNLSLVNSEFYGQGQIFDWLNASYVAIENNPNIKFRDFNAEEELAKIEAEKKVLEDKKVEVAPVKEEVVTEAIKVDEKTDTSIIVEPTIKVISNDKAGTETTASTNINTTTDNNNGSVDTTNATDTTVEEDTTVAEDTSLTENSATTVNSADTNQNDLPDFFEKNYSLPDASNLANKDSDNDGLTNAQEYANGTDPLRSDSDGDGISDSNEIANGTDPTNEDSDGDLISDGDEIKAGTNPLNTDSDGNGVSDYVESKFDVKGGTTDTNANNIPDELEKKITEETGITITNGYQDSDGDGLSDAYEAIKGTNLNDANSFDSQISDTELILDYNNVMSRRKDRDAYIRSTKKASIVNIKSGEVLFDKTPVFKGTAPDGSIVVFYYQDPNTGIGIEMGRVPAGGGDKYIFEPIDDLPLGINNIFVRVYNTNNISIDNIKTIEITIANPISEIDKALAESPKVESINESIIETKQAEVESNKANPLTANERAAKIERLKLQYAKGQKNTIRGYAKPGSIIEAYWQSLVVSSAVIADAKTGYYEISPGSDLGEGDHTAWLYSVDPKTSVKSENTKVEFSIGESTQATVLKLDNGKTITLMFLGVLVLLGGITFVIRKKKSMPTAS